MKSSLLKNDYSAQVLEVLSIGQFAQNCCQKNSQNNVCIITLATEGLLLCRMMAKLAQSALRKAGKQLC